MTSTPGTIPGGRAGERVVALAGVLQGAVLVNEVARTGWPARDAAALRASIASVLRIDADSPAAVFGGVTGVRLGLETLTSLLERGAASINPDVLRYAFAAMQLERHLARTPAVVSALGEGLRNLQLPTHSVPPGNGGTHTAEHVAAPPLGDTVVHDLAGLYQRTLSTLRFRVQVFGNPELLQQPPVADGVRACLLATVRAAWLWRQLGGRRWRLALERNAMRRALASLLDDNPSISGNLH